MPVFQDSLLVSEVPEWVDMLQPVHSPDPGEIIAPVDFEADPEHDAKPEEGAETISRRTV
jgi:hypothetical protein